jgi:hypothetical protein
MPIISVKDNIADAVQFGLQQITVANGYANTIANVYDPPKDIGAMSEFPCFNYYEGPDDCSNASNPGSHEQTGGNQCKLFNSFIIELDGYVNDMNTPRKARNSLLADVQKYFGLHWNIPDITGIPSAFSSLYIGSVPFGETINAPQLGVSIRIKVWYDQKLTDPKLRG